MANIICNTIQAHVIRQVADSSFEQLLLRRSENTFPYPLMWQVVTGRIEPNETALATAYREVVEETGIIPIKGWTVPFVASFFMPRTDSISLSPVFAFFVESADVKLSDEHSDYKWIPLLETGRFISFPGQIEGSRIINDFILYPINDCMYEISEELWRQLRHV